VVAYVRQVNRGLIVVFVLLQVVSFAAIPSLIRNGIICNTVQAQPPGYYWVTFESRELTGVDVNHGSINLEGAVSTFPTRKWYSPGQQVICITFIPPKHVTCNFVKWEFSGSVFDTGANVVGEPQCIVVNVAGPGVVRAVYRYLAYEVNFGSREETGVDVNRGILSIGGEHRALPRTEFCYPGQIIDLLFYPEFSNEDFVRWEAVGGLTISGTGAGYVPLTVTGPGNVTAVYRYRVYDVALESREDNGGSYNKGSITLAGVGYSLPAGVTTRSGVSVSYSPANNYAFVMWERVVSTNIGVDSPTSASTTLTITGSGSTLRAVYKYTGPYGITFGSGEENGVSLNKGSITLAGSVLNLPAINVMKPPGTYSVSYSPVSGYAFVRWEASGGYLSVSDPNSASTTLTVTGLGTLRAIYKYTGFSIHLESSEDNKASSNKGTITFDGAVLSLPADVMKPPGTYSVSYTPAAGCTFVRWEVSGGVSVSSSSSASTSLTVTGSGALRAIYTYTGFSINLESREDNGASMNKGTITFDGAVLSLPGSVIKLPGTYPVSYSPASGYVFVRWEVSGYGFVIGSSSVSTSLTVEGPGTLRAVYITGFSIRLSSMEDHARGVDEGTIVLAGIASNLPGSVIKLPGTYPVSYSPASNCTFVRWEVSGGVSVSSSSSASTSLTVTGSGALSAIYTYTGSYVVFLTSREDNGASMNKGTITFDGAVLSLPGDVMKVPGTYSVSYSPATGYTFVRWEKTGAVSIYNPNSASTTVTVQLTGSLKAVYAAAFGIRLESREDNGASTNKGTITLAGVGRSLPADVTASTGVSVSYSPASNYVFVRWEVSGGVSVSTSTSATTSLTVTGSGTLRAIYSYNAYVVFLTSREDNGASMNKGTITFDGAVLSLPGDVMKVPGTYSVSYSPATGYTFVRWEKTGAVSIYNPNSASTTVTVQLTGSLKAVYSITTQTLYKIDLKSREDGGATSNMGRTTFAGVAYSQLPAQVSKTAGSYSISYIPATGYAFLRWQVSGAITVTQSSSQSTTAQVTGQGTLTAVYRKGIVQRQPLPFGVALSLEPNTQSIRAGQSASFKVNVRLVYGSAPAVSLDVTDRPGNANYSFSMSTGTPPYSSDLTISTDPSTPPGTYMCTITCSALDELDSTSVTLIVEGFKSPSLLSITTKQNTVEEGESILVTGSLMPYLPATVQLIYRNPAGVEITRQVSTDTGNFTDTFKPDAAGDWSVKAKWVGDSDFEGSESSLARFSVKASPLTFALPVAAVVVVSVAAALFFYLRKKRLH
jgi:hypothetical protein